MGELILSRNGFYTDKQNKVENYMQFLTGWHGSFSINGEVKFLDLINSLEEIGAIEYIELLLDCCVENFLKELNQDCSTEKSKIVEIRISKFFELSSEELESVMDCSGVLESPIVEKNGEIVYQTQALDFVPWNNLKHIPVKISNSGKLYNWETPAEIIKKEVSVNITLGEFLYALFNELSFFGDPKTRQEQHDSLFKTIEEVNSGTCKMVTWDEIQLDLSKIKNN